MLLWELIVEPWMPGLGLGICTGSLNGAAVTVSSPDAWGHFLHLMDHSLRPFFPSGCLACLPFVCSFIFKHTPLGCLPTTEYRFAHEPDVVPGPPVWSAPDPFCLLSWPSSLSFHSLGLWLVPFILTVSSFGRIPAKSHLWVYFWVCDLCILVIFLFGPTVLQCHFYKKPKLFF